MTKVVMNLEDYKGKYAMHCHDLDSANLFCDFLNENGRCWESGEKYTTYSPFVYFKDKTVYLFNKGLYGDIETAKYYGYTILEIEDFIQEV